MALAQSPLDPTRLVAAGGRGEVHMTADGGKSWKQAVAVNDAGSDNDPVLLKWKSLCLTLPTAPVVDLAAHERDGALVAATQGLGIFLLEIETIRAAAVK